MRFEFYTDLLANCKHDVLLTEVFDTIVCWGGRGSAKTSDVIVTLVKECLSEPYFNCVVVFPTEGKIIEGVYSEIKSFIDKVNLTGYFRFTTSPAKIECKLNGNKFIFKGGKEKSSKGISKPNRVLFEEATEIDEEMHDIIVTSLRTEVGNIKKYYTFNPESKDIAYKEHWVYKRFFKKYEDNNENIYTTLLSEHNFNDPFTKKNEVFKTILIHSTYDDNPYCPTSLISSVAKFETLNPVKFKIWRYGKWSAKDNLLQFANQFKLSVHTSSNVKYCDDLPIHLSFDQNYLPYSTCTIYQTYTEEVNYINIIDEICLTPPNNSSEDICDVILNRYDPSMIFIYGDFSGNSRTQAISNSTYQNHYDLILSKLSKYIRPNSKRVYVNPKRALRRDIVNSILQDTNGYKLRISSKCVNTINDFEQLEIDVNNNYKKKKNKEGHEVLAHCMDTFIYFIHGAYYNLFKH